MSRWCSGAPCHHGTSYMRTSALDFGSSATRLFLLTVVAIVGICVKVIAA